MSLDETAQLPLINLNEAVFNFQEACLCSGLTRMYKCTSVPFHASNQLGLPPPYEMWRAHFSHTGGVWELLGQWWRLKWTGNEWWWPCSCWVFVFVFLLKMKCLIPFSNCENSVFHCNFWEKFNLLPWQSYFVFSSQTRPTLSGFNPDKFCRVFVTSWDSHHAYWTGTISDWFAEWCSESSLNQRVLHRFIQ